MVGENRYCPYCGTKLVIKPFDGGQSIVNGLWCSHCQVAFRLGSLDVGFPDTPYRGGRYNDDA